MRVDKLMNEDNFCLYFTDEDDTEWFYDIYDCWNSSYVYAKHFPYVEALKKRLYLRMRDSFSKGQDIQLYSDVELEGVRLSIE